jgi:hypothetical protein
MKLIICDGLAKSGSTFFFQLIKRIVPTVEPSFLFDGKMPHYIHTHNGVETGFISDPMLFLQDLKKLEGRLPNVDLVIKTHFLKDISCEINGLEIIHFITVRDPFDVALALYDQSKREKAQADAGNTFREGFMTLDTVDKALTSAIGFLRILSKADRRRICLLKYPEFVSMTGSSCDSISSILGVDKETLSSTAKLMDEMSRKGNVWTEFNQGIHGRGASAMERFDPDKAEEALSLYQGLFMD